MTDHAAIRYVSARTVAQRWDCSVDVARTRLRSAGLARYDFGTRSHRWLLDDIVALEQAALVGSSRPLPDAGEDRLRPRPGARRGPRPCLVEANR